MRKICPVVTTKSELIFSVTSAQRNFTTQTTVSSEIEIKMWFMHGFFNLSQIMYNLQGFWIRMHFLLITSTIITIFNHLGKIVISLRSGRVYAFGAFSPYSDLKKKKCFHLWNMVCCECLKWHCPNTTPGIIFCHPACRSSVWCTKLSAIVIFVRHLYLHVYILRSMQSQQS